MSPEDAPVNSNINRDGTFANENMHRYTRAKQTGGTEDCPQISWSTAEVIFDKHGGPFDAEAAVRRGIVNYHQDGDSNGDE
jgi:hypothetical protein